jgi:ribosomal-protein-alanine N-acetyltransferase
MAAQAAVILEELETARAAPIMSTDWRNALPVLMNRTVTLRELRLSDAPSLLENLATAQVERFISQPPTTAAGFERFIQWTHRTRAAGEYICFGIVPRGGEHAVGILQVRRLEPGFGAAEWGFALGSGLWGTGIFVESARLVVDFVFEVVGVHRLEARAALQNGRGSGALAKLGAVCECTLRRSFLRNGQYLDQTLWSILKDDWLQSKAVWGDKVH